MKHKVVRLMNLCLLCALFVSLLSITAIAVEVTGVEGVEVTCDSNGTISESNGTITVKAAGSYTTRKTTVITIKNTSGSTATISFNVTTSNIDSDVSTIDDLGGSFSQVLTAGQTVTFKLCSTRFSLDNTGVATLSSFKVEIAAASSDVTVNYGSDGSVTIDGNAVTSGTTTSLSSTSTHTFVAAPASGATFLGWVDGNSKLLSTSTTYSLTPTADMSIQAVFVDSTSDTAWFLVDDTYLVNNLTTAGSKGAKIVLMNNGTLTGTHTIASGDTLVIPCNDDHDVYTTKPGHDGLNTYTKPTAYRTLTMAENAKITVADGGAISICGKAGNHLSGSSDIASSLWNNNGAPSGPLGWISMTNGSDITVNSGGNLYAWGYVTGSGSVTVKSGGNLYENLQIRDYRGGDYTVKMVDNDYKVFPFSQYFVQNIEVPLTLESGAIETVCMSVTYSVLGYGDVAQENGVFIGKDSGLIQLQEGSITRRYDGNLDRVIYDLSGIASLDSVSISIKLTNTKSATINSANYIMPINGNMTINANSESKISVNKDIALLPGAIMNIDEGATVTLASGKQLIVYDTAIQWVSTNGTAREATAWTTGYCCYNNAKYYSILYAPGKASSASRSWVDAQVVVNGTLDASAGYIYNTAYGDNNGNVCSTGNGTIITGSAGTSAETYIYYQDSTADLGIDHSYIGISTSPVQMMNADTTYVKTADSSATTNKYTYTDGKWICETHTGVDTDHTCDVCGYETACVDADGDYVCDVCGQSMCAHEGMTLVEAKDGYCGEQGNTAYYTCVCGKYFNEANEEIEKDSWVTDSLGHVNLNETPASPSTCSTPGNSAYWQCVDCELYFSDAAAENEIEVGEWEQPKTSHSGGTATCVALAKCDTCGEEYGELAGHTYGNAVVNWTEGFETYNVTVTCSVCDENTEDHTKTSETLNAEMAVTDGDCKTKSSVTYTANGTFEGVSYDKTETIEGELGAHTYGEVTYTWNGYSECTATRACKNCGDKQTATSQSSITDTVDASHAAPGSTTHTATFDGVAWAEAQVQTEEIAAAGHTAGTAVVENEVAATCTTDGSYDSVTYCSGCGEEISRETKTVEALGHIPGAAATCATPQVCTREGCGAELAPATGNHSYTVEVANSRVDATCKATGSVTMQCATCTATQVQTLSIDEDNHTGVNHTENATAADCENTGYTGDTVCECGVTVATGEVIEAKGHDYELTDSKDATCTEDGYKIYTCKNDASHTYTTTLPQTGHTAGETVVENNVPATCTTDGSYDNVTYCTVCDAELSRETVTVEKLAHTPAAAVVENRKESTCTTDGSYDSVVYCTVCEEELSRQNVTVDALGHAEVSHEAQAPTCTKKGWDAYVTCSRCDYSTYAEKPALGHDMVIDAAVAATCTSDGKTEGSHCSRCNDATTAQEVVPALGHSFTNYVSNNNASFDADGTKTAKCDRCDATDTITDEGTKLTAVAQIGDDLYVSLAAAFDAAQNGNTIKLLTDVTPGKYLSVTTEGKITLDLNGYKITRAGTGVYVNNAATELTITGNGGITAQHAIWAAAGKVTIENGTFHGTDVTVYTSGTGAVVINGGTFSADATDGVGTADKYCVLNQMDSARDTSSITVYGGTFKGFDPANNASEGANTNFCAEGYTTAKVGDTYTVGTLPNAEVVNLGYITVDNYNIYTSGLTAGTTPIDLQVAMEFIAKDTAEQAKANVFGDYTTDFYITIDGITDGSFVADGCYLAGHYGDFGWIMIPLDGMTIEDGVVYPVITSFDFDFSYVDICTSVKDFKCGIYFSDAVIKANPDMQVTLTLGLSENLEAAQSAEFITVDEPYTYEVKDMLRVAEVNGTKYATLAEAVAAANDGDTVTVLTDIALTDVVNATGKTVDFNGHTVSGTVIGTLKLNGGTLITAEGYKMAGPEADYYQTSDAVLNIDAGSNITVLSGTMTLAQSWWTGANQILTIAEGATFVIPEDMTLNVLSTVVVKGTVTINGEVNLYSADATVEAADGLENIVTTAGDKVWYTDGKYIVHSHTVVIDAAVAATCTETGLTVGRHCSVCDEVLVAQTVVDALGHTEGDVKVENSVAATCGTEGSYDNVVYCTVCDAEISRETTTVEATGEHNYVTETERVDATCTVDGYYIMACACGATEKTTLTKTGHTSGVAATCTTAQICTVCNTELAPATGHTYDQQNTDIKYRKSAATCTEKAVYYYSCECGEQGTTTFEYGDALGHSYEAVVTAPTCTADGYTTYTCSVCDHTYVADEVVTTGHGEEEVTYAQITDKKQHNVISTCKTCGTVVTTTAADCADSDDPDNKCDACNRELGKAVVFDNKTGATPIATINNPETGIVGKPYTFTVACAKPCVVAYTKDDGATYTRMTATKSGDAYSFTVDKLTENMKFVVVLTGDTNGDGLVNTNDVSLLRSVCGRRETVDNLYRLASDVNKDSLVNTNDVSMLRSICGRRENAIW